MKLYLFTKYASKSLKSASGLLDINSLPFPQMFLYFKKKAVVVKKQNKKKNTVAVLETHIFDQKGMQHNIS